MTDHTDLIRRLEAGETGPEINWEIHLVLHPEAAGQKLAITPEYSRSVDAALAHMVPEGWKPIEISWLPAGGARVHLYSWSKHKGQSGRAPTAAAAICAAGLRAREVEDG